MKKRTAPQRAKLRAVRFIHKTHQVSFSAAVSMFHRASKAQREELKRLTGAR